VIARTIRIYLDSCCLGRLYDDNAQERVRREVEAVRAVLRRVRMGEVKLVASSMSVVENMRDSSHLRQQGAQLLLDMATVHVDFDDTDIQRAEQLHGMGFGKADAYHVVAAEKASCDVLLTTDDRLIRKAAQHNQLLQVRVINPVDWAMESGYDNET